MSGIPEQAVPGAVGGRGLGAAGLGSGGVLWADGKGSVTEGGAC